MKIEVTYKLTETKFSPNAPMTRAMLLTVLARADGQDTTAPEGGKWYDVGMKWAVEQGIITGKGGGILFPALVQRLAVRAQFFYALRHFVNSAKVPQTSEHRNDAELSH